MVAKAFMMNEKTADISIQNGGGCRADIPAGAYSIASANTMLPFTNVMVTVKLTGKQIISVLEDAIESATKPITPSTGAYPYCAGLRFNVDVSMAKGSRISHVQVNPRLAGSWNAIDENKIYTVVTNDFVAAGQDGYTTLGAIPAYLKINTFTFYAQSFIDYLRNTDGTIADLPDAEYSTQRFKNSSGCDHACNGTCGGRTGAQICTVDSNDPNCASGFNLNILHVNDHHSYIEEYSYALDTASLPLSSAAIKSVNIKYGGFPRIVQYLNTFNNNKYFPNVLKLHAGDALTGTLWYTLFKGDADARMMGYACFDAFELGNHEFDDGTTPQSPTPFEIMSIPFFLF